MAVSLVLAQYMKRVRSVAGSAVIIGFAAFMLSAVSSILEDDIYSYFAPLKYFDPGYTLNNGHFDAGFVICAALLFVGCFAFAYTGFTRNDIASV